MPQPSAAWLPPTFPDSTPSEAPTARTATAPSSPRRVAGDRSSSGRRPPSGGQPTFLSLSRVRLDGRRSPRSLTASRRCCRLRRTRLTGEARIASKTRVSTALAAPRLAACCSRPPPYPSRFSIHPDLIPLSTLVAAGRGGVGERALRYPFLAAGGRPRHCRGLADCTV